LDALEHSQTAPVCALALVLFCIAFLSVTRVRLRACTVACRSGRAPPSA
jgi:hypothetical protein